ncbi:MAG: hypothetical protein LBJ08_05400, partial [Bifidobacteriaceae bacterium]|nr:hypothetical protein [Bifidobacteriaceae bacterium]
MPGTNLTRREAAERAALIDVESYGVQLDLTDSAETFASTSIVHFNCASVGSATFIDLIAPHV